MSVRTTIAAMGLGGAAAAALLAVGAGPAAAVGPHHHAYDEQARSHAVFVEANDPSGNTIAVYHRNGDGSLTAAGRYATGGLGGVLTGSVVDHLASQGAVTYDAERSLLYAVNAGSNTVTVFAVHGDRLQRLDVVSTGGTFPVSVTVHRGIVYVLNARDGGSIQGFVQFGGALVRIPAWHRSLGLDATATPEFVNTPGQIAFTPDGDHLVVTTKANGSHIDVFTVDGIGRPSAAPTVTTDPAGVPFAVAFDRTGAIDVAEAGQNTVSRFTVDPDGTLTFVDQVATGQRATCWLVAGGSQLFADNAGSASVSTIDVTDNGLVNRATTPTHPGTIDAAVSGNTLYVETGATGTVDEFAIGSDGTLTAIGSVTVAGTIGGEGIAAS